MDGIHDIGGKDGFGPVVVEENEPVFHAGWEAAVFAMANAGAAAGAWNNTDRFRHSIERIDPVAYLTHGYYGRWLGGIETLLIEAGIITRASLDKKVYELGGSPIDLVAARPNPEPEPLGPVLAERTALRRVSQTPRFARGDRVRTSSEVKSGHTRLPAYARNKTGLIILAHDAWVYPDSNAHGFGEDPQYLYTVQFTGEELWGNGETEDKVSLDLFEPYLSLVVHGDAND